VRQLCDDLIPSAQIGFATNSEFPQNQLVRWIPAGFVNKVSPHRGRLETEPRLGLVIVVAFNPVEQIARIIPLLVDTARWQPRPQSGYGTCQRRCFLGSLEESGI
jgi:hypothetical protein